MHPGPGVAQATMHTGPSVVCITAYPKTKGTITVFATHEALCSIWAPTATTRHIGALPSRPPFLVLHVPRGPFLRVPRPLPTSMRNGGQELQGGTWQARNLATGPPST